MNTIEDIRKIANESIREGILSLGSEPLLSDIKGHIPTGWTLLDANMRGGFPMGRTSEVYGKESAGKTSLVIHAMANCQKMGGVVVLFEPENTFPKELARKMGVDTERLVVVSPDTPLEEAFTFLSKVIKVVRNELKDVPILVVWDTMSATQSKKEADGDDDGGRMAGQYRATVIRKGMRLLTHSIAQASVALVILNHTFDSVDVRTGIVYTDTPGGRGVKFYATIRIHLKASGYIRIKESDHKTDPIGINVTARFEKNKISTPRREVDCRFYFGFGFDDRWSIFDYAVESNIIGKSGSWYTYGNTKFYSTKWLEKLDENPDMFDEIKSKVLLKYTTSIM